MINNKFMWFLNFHRVLMSFLAGDISLRDLAEHLAMLGSGFEFNEEDVLIPPTDPSDLALNQAVHHILKEEGVLGDLRGFFSVDADLDEEHDLKVACKGYDENLIKFLQESPDNAFFKK